MTRKFLFADDVLILYCNISDIVRQPTVRVCKVYNLFPEMRRCIHMRVRARTHISHVLLLINEATNATYQKRSSPAMKLRNIHLTNTRIIISIIFIIDTVRAGDRSYFFRV